VGTFLRDSVFSTASKYNLSILKCDEFLNTKMLTQEVPVFGTRRQSCWFRWHYECCPLTISTMWQTLLLN